MSIQNTDDANENDVSFHAIKDGSLEEASVDDIQEPHFVTPSLHLINRIAELEETTRKQAELMSLNGKEQLFSNKVLSELHQWYTRSEEAMRAINRGINGEVFLPVMDKDQYESLSKKVNDALTPVRHFISHLTDTDTALRSLQHEKIQWLQEKETLLNDAMEHEVLAAGKTEYLRQDLFTIKKRIKTLDDELACAKEEIAEKMDMIVSLTHKIGEYDNLVAGLKGELEWEMQLRKNSDKTICSLIDNFKDALALRSLAYEEKVETLKAFTNAMERDFSITHVKIASLESEVKERENGKVAAVLKAVVDSPGEGTQILSTYPYIDEGPSEGIADHTIITSLNTMKAPPSFKQASMFWIEGHHELEVLRGRIKQLLAEKSNISTCDERGPNVIKNDPGRRLEQSVLPNENDTKDTFREKSQLVASLAAALEEVEHVRIANNKLKDELAGLQWTNEFLVAELIRGSGNAKSPDCLLPMNDATITSSSHSRYGDPPSDVYCDVNSSLIEKGNMMKILKRDINQIVEAAKSARKGIEDIVDPGELKAATEAHHKLKIDIVKLHKEQGVLTKLCEYKKRQLAAATRESIVMSTNQQKIMTEESLADDSALVTVVVNQKTSISYSNILEIIDDMVSISMESSDTVSDESRGTASDFILFLNALGSVLSSLDEDLTNRLKAIIDDSTIDSKAVSLKILKENILLQMRLREIEATVGEYQKDLIVFDDVSDMMLSEEDSHQHEALILSTVNKGTEKRKEILNNLAVLSVENKRLKRELEEALSTIKDLNDHMIPLLKHDVSVLQNKQTEIETSREYMMDICLKLAAATSRTLMGAKEKQTKMNYMERELSVVRDALWDCSRKATTDTCGDDNRETLGEQVVNEDIKIINKRRQSCSAVKWLRKMLVELIRQGVIQVSDTSPAKSRLSGFKRILRDDNNGDENVESVDSHNGVLSSHSSSFISSSLDDILHTFIDSTNHYIKSLITTEYFNHMQGFRMLLQLVQTLQESNKRVVTEYSKMAKTVSIEVAEAMAMALYKEAFIKGNYNPIHTKGRNSDEDDICDEDDIVRLAEEYSAKGSSILNT